MQLLQRSNARRRIVSATIFPHLGLVAGETPRHPGILPADDHAMWKGKTMTTLIERLKVAADKRARFLRTRDEIARMPLDVALDLNIYPGDASRIAYEAVYGRA